MSTPPYDYATIFRSNKKMTFEVPIPEIPNLSTNEFFKPPEKVITPEQRTEEYNYLKDRYLDLFCQNVQGRTIDLKPKDKDQIIDIQSYKSAIKKLVARGLWNRSYGADALQLQIINYNELIINKIKYEIIAKAVVTEAVKKMEMFLISCCQWKIEPTCIHELPCIYNVLLNSRTKMKQEESQVFMNVIKGIYGLGDYVLTQLKALQVILAIRGYIFEAESNKKEALRMSFVLNQKYRPPEISKSKLFVRKNNIKSSKAQQMLSLMEQNTEKIATSDDLQDFPDIHIQFAEEGYDQDENQNQNLLQQCSESKSNDMID